MKRISLGVLATIVGSTIVALAPATGAVRAATTSTATKVSGMSSAAADAAVGDSGLGDARGVDVARSGSTRWLVFESSASNLVANDTNNASDIFVTDGTTITRLSVAANGAQGSVGAASYDPSICESGRKVVFTTDNEWSDVDANGATDVYVIDRDADADGTMDEFSQTSPTPGVTVNIVSVSYNTDLGEFDTAFLGAGGGVISGDCNKVAFVTDTEFSLDDFNFGPDVYVRDLNSPNTPAVWATTFASGGGEGGGFLPDLSNTGASVVFATQATDVVSSSGTTSGLILRNFGTSTTAQYVTRNTSGASSATALPDGDRSADITPDGTCIAFKADRGYDLLAGNSGPAQGVYLWDGRGSTPTVTLVSKDAFGIAASSASNPRVSDDCRFVAYDSSDEFLSSSDNNRKADVFLYDTSDGTTTLVSRGAGAASSDGVSTLAALDWNSSTGEGVVYLTSSASNISGLSGGDSVIDLFSVPFTAASTGSTSSSAFVALSPSRLFDTRSGAGGVTKAKVGDGAGNGAALEFTVTGKGGLPSSASSIGAVSLNVTVVSGEAPNEGGYVTVYPCGTRPEASNLNFVFGQTVPNAVITPISSSGKVCFYVYGKADLLADVNGYFAASAGFTSVTPARLFDTRSGAGGVTKAKVGDGAGNGAALEFTVNGKGGLPATGIGAVSLNVTVVSGEAPNEGGYVTVYPCGTRPEASSLNFVFGQTVPNAVIAPVSSAGKVCFYVYGKADLLADVNGYFGSSGINVLSPARLFDTRSGAGGVTKAKVGDGAGNGAALEFTITGKGGVPSSGVGAVSLNVTVVSGEAPNEGGYVTVYPCGTRPEASSLNFVFGQTVPNAVITPISSSGKVCFYVYGKADLLADVNGWFAIAT